jgi:TPR repeat protein
MRPPGTAPLHRNLDLLAFGPGTHYSAIQMLNRTLAAFMFCSLAAAIHVPGRPVESERALFNQVKAQADKGDAEAQLQLGNFYANGVGVAPDTSKAFKWHRKAAEKGLASAQYQVGMDYVNGDGVKSSRAEAVHWFRAAAEKGFGQAQLELGLCYMEGRGIEANEVEALKWFRSASGGGLAYADYEIGNCYLQGIGVARDVEEATKWTRQAAEKGVAAAQNSLGIAYERGEGVPKDYVQAYKWFALAAAHDDEHAADIRVNLAKVEINLTKEQIAEAQRLAHAFKPTETAPGDSKAKNEIPPKDQGQSTNSGGGSLANGPAKTGSVTVKAHDEDCEVLVDGVFVGNSPARVQLAEGAHVFELRKAGFKSFRRELKVIAGSELSLNATLEKE